MLHRMTDSIRDSDLANLACIDDARRRHQLIADISSNLVNAAIGPSILFPIFRRRISRMMFAVLGGAADTTLVYLFSARSHERHDIFHRETRTMTPLYSTHARARARVPRALR